MQIKQNQLKMKVVQSQDKKGKWASQICLCPSPFDVFQGLKFQLLKVFKWQFLEKNGKTRSIFEKKHPFFEIFLRYFAKDKRLCFS